MQVEQDLDFKSIAKKVIELADLQPGERVWMLAHPDQYPEFVEPMRRYLSDAGAMDLGVTSVTDISPASWQSEFTLGMAGLEGGVLNSYLSDVDLGIMLPGAIPDDLPYKAMQEVLHSGQSRTIHFHWSGAYDLNQNALVITPEIDYFYQGAILGTDYEKLKEAQQTFEDTIREKNVRITTPAGTDVQFRIGSRPVTKQDGDASMKRSQEAKNLIDREIEIPAGAIRVAPIEESVNGKIAFPDARWSNQEVKGLLMTIEQGKVVHWVADSGAEGVEAELQSAGDAGRSFREFAMGLNPMLAIPDRDPWIPYYGYGSGVVRLSLGDNTELGGAVGGGYVRWNFFPDATVMVGEEVWVKDGKLMR